MKFICNLYYRFKFPLLEMNIFRSGTRSTLSYPALLMEQMFNHSFLKKILFIFIHMWKKYLHKLRQNYSITQIQYKKVDHFSLITFYKRETQDLVYKPRVKINLFISHRETFPYTNMPLNQFKWSYKQTISPILTKVMFGFVCGATDNLCTLIRLFGPRPTT